MSRYVSTKHFVKFPESVKVDIQEDKVSVFGPLGSAVYVLLNNDIFLKEENGIITFSSSERSRKISSVIGTMKALIRNIILGVSIGFEKKLILVGIGFRASKEVQNDIIMLNIGFSHEIQYKIPKGIQIECPSQTEIIIKGLNKELVGQVSAEIRSYRPPEPYKGKGIRYSDEVPLIKETKKKR